MNDGELIDIDGAAGEGGGQILRSSLALSVVTGKPFRITGIRAGRKKPGLLRQHLTAVHAAVQISSAAVKGAEIGSGELVFRPEAVRPGEYAFAVGTAGSTTLVLQTVLPPLLLAGAPSRLTLEGGTHNPFAPPFDFLERAFLPQLAKLGCAVQATLVRPGFYPAGGGRMEVEITPADGLRPLQLLDRGGELGRRVVANISSLPPTAAERAFAQIEHRLGWPREAMEVREHTCGGPGFAVHAEVLSPNCSELLTAFGERGVRAERVADLLCDEVGAYLAHNAPVGEHLADQLLLPMALAGGAAFRTAALSSHARTSIDIIQQFLPVRFETHPAEEGGVEVRIGTPASSE